MLVVGKEDVMSTDLSDVVLHIDETLPLNEVNVLETHIQNIGGVVSACNRDERPHLISITYNPARVKSHDILVKVESEGIHAELVGL